MNLRSQMDGRRDEYTSGNTWLSKLREALPRAVTETCSSILARTGLDAHIALLFDSALRRRGWFESYRSAPIGIDGDPIPWMPYSFIDFATDRLDQSFRVFEFGSGNSTIWWAKHTDSVVAVEDDDDWYQHILERLPENAELLQYESEEFAKSISEYDEFDVICIDGEKRIECSRVAVDHLSEQGIIIWDDSDREKYQEGLELLKDQGFNEIAFQGMGPVSNSLQRTSVFYREGNCFKI